VIKSVRINEKGSQKHNAKAGAEISWKQYQINTDRDYNSLIKRFQNMKISFSNNITDVL